MASIAGLLTAHGFSARVEETEFSSSVVSENCPFGTAAQHHPVLCAVDRGLIAGMLEGLGAERTIVTLTSKAMGDETAASPPESVRRQVQRQQKRSGDGELGARGMQRQENFELTLSQRLVAGSGVGHDRVVQACCGVARAGGDRVAQVIDANRDERGVRRRTARREVEPPVSVRAATFLGSRLSTLWYAWSAADTLPAPRRFEHRSATG